MNLKGTISGRQFQTSLFSKPQIFFFFYIFRENFTVIAYLHNNLLKHQDIFGKRDNSLLASELIIAGDN